MHCMEENLFERLRWRVGHEHKLDVMSERCIGGSRFLWAAIDFLEIMIDDLRIYFLTFMMMMKKKKLRATLLYEFTILSTYLSLVEWLKLCCFMMCLRSS